MDVSQKTQSKMVIENILRRRSLKPHFMQADKAIERPLLLQLLECANWAPTHKLTEPWRFSIFSGAGRDRLGRVMAEAYRVYAGEGFKEAKYQKSLSRPLMAPVVLAINMHPGPRANLPEWEEVVAVGCAVQNIHLAAHSMGIAGYWSSPPYLESQHLRAFLKLEGRRRCLGFFYLGYPKDAWPQSKRRSLADKLDWIDG